MSGTDLVIAFVLGALIGFAACLVMIGQDAVDQGRASGTCETHWQYVQPDTMTMLREHPECAIDGWVQP